MSTAPIQVLYVAGEGRSGSTLLDRIVGQLPGTFSAGELVHLWEKAVIADEKCGCGLPFSECPFWTKVGEEAFGGWEPDQAQRMLSLKRHLVRDRFFLQLLARRRFHELSPYQQTLAQLYREIAEQSGARLIIDSSKSITYALVLSQIEGIEVKVVHLVRDVRGVAYSWTKKVRKPEVADGVAFMDRHSPVSTALRWDKVAMLVPMLGLRGVPVLHIRYEDLVTEPDKALSAVMKFAGLPGDPVGAGILDKNTVILQPTHTVVGNPMRFKQGRVELALDDSWKRAFPVNQARMVTALTSPVLARYRYPLRIRRNG